MGESCSREPRRARHRPLPPCVGGGRAGDAMEPIFSGCECAERTCRPGSMTGMPCFSANAASSALAFRVEHAATGDDDRLLRGSEAASIADASSSIRLDAARNRPSRRRRIPDSRRLPPAVCRAIASPARIRQDRSGPCMARRSAGNDLLRAGWMRSKYRETGLKAVIRRDRASPKPPLAEHRVGPAVGEERRREGGEPAVD